MIKGVHIGEWEGGEGREGGRKIFSALQTSTGDPCIVSPEIRWEMQTKRKLIC